jgi:hypothetical protein
MPASDEEVRLAALQYVRKVSGYRVPSRANTAAFEAAVDEITAATGALLARLGRPESAAAPARSSSH